MTQAERVKLGAVLLASTQIQIELIDRLKGTNLYKHNLKNQYNKVQKENEKLITSFYGGIQEDAELVFYHITKIVENFVTAIEKKDISVVDAFLQDYLNDNLRIEEDESN